MKTTKTTKTTSAARKAKASRMKWRLKVKRVRKAARPALRDVKGTDRRLALALIVQMVNAGQNVRTASAVVVKHLLRGGKRDAVRVVRAAKAHD